MRIQCQICNVNKELPENTMVSELEGLGYSFWGYMTSGVRKEWYVTCKSCEKKQDEEIRAKRKENEERMAAENAKRFDVIIPKNIVVCSDFLLGNPDCNRAAVYRIITSKFKKLIITGNIIDSIYAAALTQWDEHLIDILEHHQKSGKLVAIRGQEEDYIDYIDYFSNITYVEDYTWEYLDMKFHAVSAYNVPSARVLNIKADATTKERATAFANEKQFSAIFVGGETPEIETVGKTLYVNTGHFLKKPDKLIHWAAMDGLNNEIALNNNRNNLHELERTYIDGIKFKGGVTTYDKPVINSTPNVNYKPFFTFPRVNNKQFLELN